MAIIPVPDVIVWVDIETTGLIPAREVILEIGAIVTDNTGTVLSQWHNFVYEDSFPFAFARADDFVKNMHTKSGLLDAVSGLAGRNAVSPENVEDDFLRWVNGLELSSSCYLGLPSSCYAMAGSSVHFDRAFLELRMPKISQWFHYRNIDVSTLKNLCKILNPSVAKAIPAKRENHRSIPDLEDTIAEYKFYLDNFLHVDL